MTQRKITSASINDNIEFPGDYIVIPSGTTAERPASPAVGMIRYNTDLGLIEQYNNAGWQAIDAPPIISNCSPTSYNGEQGTSITINGTNFKSGSYVSFVDINNYAYNASSTSFVNTSQLIATTPQDFTAAQGPLTIRVTNPSGLSNNLAAALDTGTSPTWITSSGSLGTFGGGNISTSVSATDADAGSSITYSIASGSLPNGLTLNSSTGAISGSNTTAQNTTYNFTIRVTDNAGNTADRNFSMTLMINYFGSGADGAGTY